jgi:V/A-type H+-transporting ATPase subunit F
MYLKAKNPPTTNPGTAMMTDKPDIKDRNRARIAHAKQATINIRIPDFVVAKASILVSLDIKVVSFWFLSKRIKGHLTQAWSRLQIVAVGSRVFVTSFQLAGVKGVKVDTSAEALAEINKMDENSGVGLVLLSDDISKEIRYQLTSLRAKRPIPLIFELPSPGTKKEKVDYRALLKQILGV